MIRNENTYYIGFYRNVRVLKPLPALVFDTICGLLRTNETGEIANSTLCDFLGITRHTLTDAINAIIKAGYLECTKGDGRGNKTVYVITEKGAENVPFMTKKGADFIPFKGEKGGRNCTKRGQNLHIKGAEIATINTELNKELNKESDGVMRETQNTSLSNTTTQILENMEDFNEFWSLFCGDGAWEHERENCERVWYTLQQSWRDNLVQQLRKGLRYRTRENDNPYWYLKNYNGEVVRGELPFVRQGTAAFGKWYNEQKRIGKRISLFRYPVGEEHNLAYCLEDDKQIMLEAGAEFVRDNV